MIRQVNTESKEYTLLEFHNKVIVRQSVRDEVLEKTGDILREAMLFIRNKYPSVNLDNIEFIVSSGYNRSRYFRNNGNRKKYQMPTVCISTRATLYLYEKRSLGLKKFKAQVGFKTQMICAAIHELTHHVQYEQEHRQGNELDTTRNELEYLAINRPLIYKRLTSK